MCWCVGGWYRPDYRCSRVLLNYHSVSVTCDVPTGPRRELRRGKTGDGDGAEGGNDTVAVG